MVHALFEQLSGIKLIGTVNAKETIKTYRFRIRSNVQIRKETRKESKNNSVTSREKFGNNLRQILNESEKDYAKFETDSARI